MPIFCKVLGARRKIIALTFSENQLCFLFSLRCFHFCFPFSYQLIVVAAVLVGKQIVIRSSKVSTSKVLNPVVPPVVFWMSKGSPELAASAVQQFALCFRNDIPEPHSFVVKPDIAPVVIVFVFDKPRCESPDFPGPPEMSCFSAEVTEIHGFLELSLATLSTTNRMDFSINQLPE